MAHKYAGIFGWCDFFDLYSEVVDRYDNCILAEIGVFQGQSSCYLGEIIKERNKNLRLVSIDLFPNEEELIKLAGQGAGQSIEKDIIRALPDSLLNIFVRNMRNAEVDDVIIPIKSDSIKASSIFPDEHFAMVFLDDNHDYTYVVEELKAWWPKVKKGGMYCGHDYQAVGVNKAVLEFVKDNNLTVQTRGACWLIYK